MATVADVGSPISDGSIKVAGSESAVNGREVRFACFFRIFRVASPVAYWNYEMVSHTNSQLSHQKEYLIQIEDGGVHLKKEAHCVPTLLELHTTSGRQSAFS